MSFNSINETYLSSLSPNTQGETMEVITMEAMAPDDTDLHPGETLNCCGTFGTMGTAGGCFGTLGTFGCMG